MKDENYSFRWFEKEDGRRPMRLTVNAEGEVWLGKALREQLPQTIRLGFDAKSRILAIADGHGQGNTIPKNGKILQKKLSSALVEAGLGLPISFSLEKDEGIGFFIGQIIPPARQTDRGKDFDSEEILQTYRHVIEKSVSVLAKSTPIEERRTIAQEALFTAVKEYRPGFGNLQNFLEKKVRQALVRENKLYSERYSVLSLHQPFSPAGDFSLLDRLSSSSDGGIASVEEKVDRERFFRSLTSLENQVYVLVQKGKTVSEIAALLRKREGVIQQIGLQIGEKRKKYLDV